IDSYPGRTRGALGHIVEVLGDADDPEVEIRTAAIQFGLPDQFSPQALTDAATLPLQVEAADLAGRTDLRQKAFVTIDGETAKDFDDAVAIDCVNDGYRLFVAIADVSHYVAPGDAIDQEAQERGTSVYFPGSCLPMLPEALSNGICSLNPGVDRLVMVAQLDFDAEGKRTDMCFYPAVICSHARLTYTEVAAILVEKDDELRAARAELLDDLERMKCLAQLRIERRRERGSLDFDLPEAQIQLDLKGRPENIIRAERNLAHRLIEEFMLAANEAVAKWLTQRQQPLLFRVHEAPSEGRMADFQQFIANFNQGLAIPVQGITQKLLLELLERVAGCPEEHVINHVLLRSLPQAYYTTDNLGHFGLAAEYYCHFTSPIRRYPDLMVHRILKQRLTASKSTFASEPSLEELAGQTSLAERRALEAERDIVKLKKCQFIADKLGLDYDGVIASVHAFGFFVELRDVYIEGLVHISTLEDDFYQFEEERHRLIGTSRRREFTIGDRVRVRVQKVDLQRREIDFSLVEAAKAPKARRRSTTGGRRRKRD
ncbi:MAG: ribonuclease R, partial [Desulfuromonadales bacterium]|nr:ribonuclease R [Desulfuromonadales bacterium]